MKDRSASFPRCLHARPYGMDIPVTPITPMQLEECQQDARLTVANATKRGFENLMGEAVPEATLLGNLAEQVFANVCMVPRQRSPDLMRCERCRRHHGPPDFPTQLDVKGKWDLMPDGRVSVMELMINRLVPRCFERFALVEVRSDKTSGKLWVVIPRWRMVKGKDVRHGRHARNKKAINWTSHGTDLSKERTLAMGDACMICGPPWRPGKEER